MTPNLDSTLNQLSCEIVEKIKKVENKQTRKKLFGHIDKALGVLANDGVFAYYIYSKSQDSKNKNDACFHDIFIHTVTERLSLFVPVATKNENSTNTKQMKYEEYYQLLAQDLKKLLFFKEILERTLIYARYHAKAQGEDYE